MKIAFAVFNNRIACILTSLDRLIIWEDQNTDDINCQTIFCKGMNKILKTLKQENVEKLICGAISECEYTIISASGIYVIPWITGNINDVIGEYQINKLISTNCIMPGCKRWGRKRCRQRKSGKKNP